MGEAVDGGSVLDAPAVAIEPIRVRPERLDEQLAFRAQVAGSRFHATELGSGPGSMNRVLTAHTATA